MFISCNLNDLRRKNSLCQTFIWYWSIFITDFNSPHHSTSSSLHFIFFLSNFFLKNCGSFDFSCDDYCGLIQHWTFYLSMYLFFVIVMGPFFAFKNTDFYQLSFPHSPYPQPFFLGERPQKWSDIKSLLLFNSMCHLIVILWCIP